MTIHHHTWGGASKPKYWEGKPYFVKLNQRPYQPCSVYWTISCTKNIVLHVSQWLMENSIVSSHREERGGVAMPSLIVHSSLIGGKEGATSLTKTALAYIDGFHCPSVARVFFKWMNPLLDIRPHRLPEGVFSFQRLQFLRRGSFSPSRRFPPPIKEIFFKENEDSSNQLAYFLL